MKACLFLAMTIACASVAIAQNCSPPTLKTELKQRVDKDQEVRRAFVASPGSKEINERALRIDADNTVFMRAMLAKCGWPKKSVVGNDAATFAWLLTQHADMDPQYQVIAAQQMKYAVLAKEADPERFSALVDRNRLLTNQPQVYGLNFSTGADKAIRFYDIINPGQLDARRAEIGLSPFYCYVLQVSRDNGKASIQWPAGVLLTPVDCSAAK